MAKRGNPNGQTSGCPRKTPTSPHSNQQSEPTLSLTDTAPADCLLPCPLVPDDAATLGCSRPLRPSRSAHGAAHSRRGTTELEQRPSRRPRRDMSEDPHTTDQKAPAAL